MDNHNTKQLSQALQVMHKLKTADDRRQNAAIGEHSYNWNHM